MSLSGCAIPVAIRNCPEPVYPSEEALVWLEGANPPPAFVEFFDRYDRQQQAIEVCYD